MTATKLMKMTALAALLACASTWAWSLESFEDGVTGWTATGGQVAPSADHWKLGQRSLRWDFTPGAVLTRASDAEWERDLAARDGGVKLWLYCETPIKGDLRCHAGGWAFPLHLGFRGWRAMWVVFSEDAKPAPAVTGLQFTAPDTAGTLFLDAVELGGVRWSRQGDAVAPYTNPERTGGKYWYTIQDYAQVPAPPAAGLSPTDRAAFSEIEKRYDAWMFGRLDDPREPVKTRLAAVKSAIERGQRAFDKLGLVRRGEVVVGPGQFCMDDSLSPHLASDVFEPLALALAYDARLNDSAAARQRFLDLVDYAHDQGWAAGSTMGTRYSDPLRMAAYVHAVYILRDYLKQQGRLARELETLRYQLGMGQTYQAPDHAGANADELRTVQMLRLLLVLMEDDSPEKVRDMQCLVRWSNAALSVAPGYGDTIKPDGTVFHHQTAYASAYGNNAMLVSSQVYWLLAGTRFALSAQTGQNIKQALLTLRFMGGKYSYPIGVSGRWPFDDDSGLVETVPAFAYMADALHDQELGAAFARLWDPTVPMLQKQFGRCEVSIYWATSPGSLPWLLDQAARYKAEGDPQGHRAYPFAAMDFHRARQWVASVRGWSQYVWNYETMPERNVYGRYSSYGTGQVFGRGTPVNRGDSGYREPGWDWLRPPGATVIRVPLEDLPKPPLHDRAYTKDPFTGGVALGGEDGLWAMRFSDPCFDTSFHFRKSVFFVGETLVCLGSGITNADAAHPTETVLYQTALKTRPDPFPLSETGAAQWLMDPVDNGYYFPDPQVVERHVWHQESRDNGGTAKTQGDFAVAWLDHGAAPSGAGYAYAIRPDTTEEALKNYAAAPDFAVLRRDDSAHVVRFPAQQLLGYALFAPAQGLSFDALAGADAPCLVMTRREGDKLRVALADPDLRLPLFTMGAMYAEGKPGKLRLSLNGSWQLESGPAKVRLSDDHTLEAECRDGLTYEVVLRAR